MLQSPANGNYQLQVSLEAPGVTGAVPEPATWAMMLIGFGAIGVSLRRRRKVTATAYPVQAARTSVSGPFLVAASLVAAVHGPVAKPEANPGRRLIATRYVRNRDINFSLITLLIFALCS